MDDLDLENSPKLTEEKLKHKWEVDEKKYNDTWQSCCMTIDRRAVTYFTQITVIIGTMIFSICQLYRLDTCDNQQTYLGLLTLLIGLMVPSPKFGDRKLG